MPSRILRGIIKKEFTLEKTAGMHPIECHIIISKYIN